MNCIKLLQLGLMELSSHHFLRRNAHTAPDSRQPQPCCCGRPVFTMAPVMMYGEANLKTRHRIRKHKYYHEEIWNYSKLLDMVKTLIFLEPWISIDTNHVK